MTPDDEAAWEAWQASEPWERRAMHTSRDRMQDTFQKSLTYEAELDRLRSERDQLLRAGREFEIEDTAGPCVCGHGSRAHICTFTATRCFGCGCTEYRALLSGDTGTPKEDE